MARLWTINPETHSLFSECKYFLIFIYLLIAVTCSSSVSLSYKPTAELCRYIKINTIKFNASRIRIYPSKKSVKFSLFTTFDSHCGVIMGKCSDFSRQIYICFKEFTNISIKLRHIPIHIRNFTII